MLSIYIYYVYKKWCQPLIHTYLQRRLKEKWRGMGKSNLKSHEAENQVEKDFEVGAFAGSRGRLSGLAIELLVLGDRVVDGLLAAEEAEPDERGQARLRAMVQVASLLDIVENLEKKIWAEN
jgi:hypothetical protein